MDQAALKFRWPENPLWGAFKCFVSNILKMLGLFEGAVMIKYRLMEMHPGFLRHKNEMMRFYSQFINPGDLCFDIGANMGNRTAVFFKLGATTIAVEPQDLCLQYLKKRYKDIRQVIVVPMACGEKEGEKELMLNNVTVLSSLSKEWIKSVQESGRLTRCSWHSYGAVPVTTLDKLIERFGKPVFCKIDVEGYEFEVLKGLSSPVKNISFEFVPEYIDAAMRCLDHLSRIGMKRFNYCQEEAMPFVLPEWVGCEEMKKTLLSLPDKTVWGDVYAR